MWWPQTLLEWVQSGAYLVAVFAALASYLQYRKNSEQERARWMFELYQRFYEKPDLKAMRILIDKGEEGTTFIAANDESKLAELDDFLNFFVFIAYLEKSGQLRRNEIQDIFRYTLRQISSNSVLQTYMKDYGYENLTKYLNKTKLSIDEAKK